MHGICERFEGEDELIIRCLNCPVTTTNIVTKYRSIIVYLVWDYWFSNKSLSVSSMWVNQVALCTVNVRLNLIICYQCLNPCNQVTQSSVLSFLLKHCIMDITLGDRSPCRLMVQITTLLVKQDSAGLTNINGASHMPQYHAVIRSDLFLECHHYKC